MHIGGVTPDTIKCNVTSISAVQNNNRAALNSGFQTAPTRIMCFGVPFIKMMILTYCISSQAFYAL